MIYRTYLVASKHTTLKQILTDFMRLSMKDTVVLSIPRKNTLGAGDFACAVSGLCQIFMVTCAKSFATGGFDLRPTPKIPAESGNQEGKGRMTLCLKLF